MRYEWDVNRSLGEGLFLCCCLKKRRGMATKNQKWVPASQAKTPEEKQSQVQAQKRASGGGRSRPRRKKKKAPHAQPTSESLKVQRSSKRVVQSENDKRHYRLLSLQNGLECMLIIE